MPSLGADMESGTLLEWFVKPGDAVKRGHIVALVDTSKAEIEIDILGRRDRPAARHRSYARADRDGARDHQCTRSVGCRPIEVPAAVATAAAPPAPEPVAIAPSPPAPTPIQVPSPAPVPIENGHRPRVSPVARRAAEQLGADLTTVSGTGPDGAIMKIDVERATTGATSTGSPAAQAFAPTSPPEAADRHQAMRDAIGALMARSKREIPHYYLELQIDMSRALEWLHDQNLTRTVDRPLLPSALLLKCMASSTRRRSHWSDSARPRAAVGRRRDARRSPDRDRHARRRSPRL